MPTIEELKDAINRRRAQLSELRERGYTRLSNAAERDVQMMESQLADIQRLDELQAKK